MDHIAILEYPRKQLYRNEQSWIITLHYSPHHIIQVYETLPTRSVPLFQNTLLFSTFYFLPILAAFAIWISILLGPIAPFLAHDFVFLSNFGVTVFEGQGWGA